jgi:hypothetical protein
MKLIFTILFFITSGSLCAQSRISGTVSAALDTSVPFAVVTLKKTATAHTSTTRTDSTGSFFFPDVKNGTYSITITHGSYEPYEARFDLSHDTTLNVQLQLTSKQLRNVTVTGTNAAIERTADKVIYNVAGSVTAAGSDALQAVSQVPGVRINNNEISLVARGAIRVMLNNRLIQLQGEDLTRYLKTFSANQILRIELLTNPSARYEVEGNGGLINIITKHSKLQGYSGNVQLASKYYLPGESSVYGKHTFGEVSGSGNLAYNWNRWSAYSSFNHVRDQHLEGFQFDLFYPNQHWLQTDTGLYTHTAYTGLVGIDYKISSAASIGASYSGGWDMYDGSDHVRNPVYNSAGALDSLLKTYAHYHPIAKPAALNFHADVKLDTTGKQLSLNADYFNYYRNDLSDFETNSYDFAGQPKPEGTMRIFDRNKQNILVYTMKADVDWPTAFATYSFGGKLSYISEYSNAFYYDKTAGGLVYNTDLSNEFNYNENTQAVYGNVSKDVNKWKLQVGLRGELTQTKGYSVMVQKTTIYNYFKVFPSMLANYVVDQNSTFSLALGRRINRPSFWNLNPFKSLFTAYSYGEGNPYLQPEYNSNLELSHAYKTMFRTSVFANRTDNGFVNVTIPDPDTNFVHTIPLNFIRTTRVGVSENFSFRPFPWWGTNFLASIYHTTAQSSLPYIKGVRATSAYLSSTNNLYFNESKTVAAAINFWYQFPDVDHIGKTDRYYKLDVGVKATTANKKWDLALNLNDAFRSSALAYSYTVNGIPQKFTNFQIIRYLQFSATYRFGSGSGISSTRTPGNEDERGRAH